MRSVPKWTRYLWRSSNKAGKTASTRALDRVLEKDEAAKHGQVIFTQKDLRRFDELIKAGVRIAKTTKPALGRRGMIVAQTIIVDTALKLSGLKHEVNSQNFGRLKRLTLNLLNLTTQGTKNPAKIKELADNTIEKIEQICGEEGTERLLREIRDLKSICRDMTD